MKFFIPNTPEAEVEAVYQKMAQSLKLQFRLPVLERRIYSLTYTNSKKNWYAQVGQMEDQQNLFQIAAIFESKTYIIVTKTNTGKDGLVIMVDKDEVTEVVEFDRVPSLPTA